MFVATSGLKSSFSSKKSVFLYTEYNAVAVSLTSVSISAIHFGMVTAAAPEDPIPESIGAEFTNSIPIINRARTCTVTVI